MTNLLHSNQRDNTGQWAVSAQRRLPVDDITTANIQTVTGEAIQYYYYTTAGVLTSDAGQVAGTVVVANLANKNILNALGDCVGSYGDSSFSFGTGTVLVTAKKRPFRGLLAEEKLLAGLSEGAAGRAKAIAVTDGFLNGEWCLDHENGVIYGKKATTGTTDTGSYSVLVGGGSSSVPENVNISKVGGVAVSTGAGASDTGTQRVTVGSTSAQSLGYDATGQDAYATIKTPSANATHLYFTLGGTNDAYLSLDDGTTDHIPLAAGSCGVLDNLTITSGVAIQAKNKTAGSNYANLGITIW